MQSFVPSVTSNYGLSTKSAKIPDFYPSVKFVQMHVHARVQSPVLLCLCTKIQTCRRQGKSGNRWEHFMSAVHNGVSADRLGGVDWRKSRMSGAVGNCVEVATLESGEIAVRNSRFPSGPALIYTRAEMAAFLAGAKDGEFDDVLS
jgi:hypothetical protein